MSYYFELTPFINRNYFKKGLSTSQPEYARVTNC